MAARKPLWLAVKAGLVIAGFSAILFTTFSAPSRVHYETSISDTFVALMQTQRIARIESHMRSTIKGIGAALPDTHFNPFPSTLVTHKTAERFADGHMYRIEGNKVYCAEFGITLYQPKNEESIFTLIGIAPRELGIWARNLQQPREIVAVYVALHELGHVFIRTMPQAFMDVMIDKTPGQRILVSEIYSDVAALDALAIEFPEQQVLDFAYALAQYRAQRSERDPRHDTSEAIAEWIENQKNWRRDPKLIQLESYYRSMASLPGYIPAELRDIPLKTGRKPCRQAPDSVVSAARTDP